MVTDKFLLFNVIEMIGVCCYTANSYILINNNFSACFQHFLLAPGGSLFPIFALFLLTIEKANVPFISFKKKYFFKWHMTLSPFYPRGIKILQKLNTRLRLIPELQHFVFFLCPVEGAVTILCSAHFYSASLHKGLQTK